MPAVGLNLFFCVRLHLGAGPLDDVLGILVGQFQETPITLQGLSQSIDFFRPYMTGGVLPMGPGLQLVVGARIGGTPRWRVGRELASLHALDGDDLGQELLKRIGICHK